MPLGPRWLHVLGVAGYGWTKGNGKGVWGQKHTGASHRSPGPRIARADRSSCPAIRTRVDRAQSRLVTAPVASYRNVLRRTSRWPGCPASCQVAWYSAMPSASSDIAALTRPTISGSPEQLCHQQLWPARFQEIARAIKNATVAASPPMSTVWIALRRGAVPVKRLLIYPKTAKAMRVTITETVNAVLAVEKSI